MKNILRHWAIAAAGAAAAIALSSCVYDPYYTSAGGSYSTGSGYGDGYGYGNSGFSTSVFVGTGNANWGYDPYRYSYYDYSRRSYYDPYLNGYYPVGYLPPIVYGVPHPYGYRRGYCPPPSHVRYNTISNYRNREYAYRNSSYGWARQVRQQPITQGRVQDKHPSRQTSGSRYSTDSRSSSSYRTESRGNSAVRSSGSSSRKIDGRTSSSMGVKPGIREQQGGRLPSGYNTPVTRSSSNKNKSIQGSVRTQSRQPSQPDIRSRGGSGGGRTSQPAPQQRGNTKSNGRQEEKRGIRGLGQG